MTFSNTQKLEIIRKKIDQLDKLYELARWRESAGPVDSRNDISLLLRFTLSLERQIRQLRAEFKSHIEDSQAKPEK